MKQIELTHGKFALVDENWYEELGKLSWYAKKSAHNWYAVRAVREGNAVRTVRMHRVIADCPEDMEVHHINGNTLDNRYLNLEVVTKEWNVKEMRKRNGVKDDDEPPNESQS